MLHVTSFVGVSVVTALLGLFRAWFHIPITIVYADFLPVERLVAALYENMFIKFGYYYIDFHPDTACTYSRRAY